MRVSRRSEITGDAEDKRSARVRPQDGNAEAGDLKDLLRRIELRADETHLLLDCEQLFPGEHPELSLAASRRRLSEGEQAVAERGGAAAIRLVLPEGAVSLSSTCLR